MTQLPKMGVLKILDRRGRMIDQTLYLGDAVVFGRAAQNHVISGAVLTSAELPPVAIVMGPFGSPADAEVAIELGQSFSLRFTSSPRFL